MDNDLKQGHAEAGIHDHQKPKRISSLDTLRGLVIILMALDHTRHFWFSPGYSSTDLAHTSPTLFLTRWITHLCAPTFIFLAGTGAWLYREHHRIDTVSLAGHLISRGIWIVLLEMTWNTYFWTFQLHTLELQVLWAIGWSMILLAGLVFLPRALLLSLAITGIAGHNLLDSIQPGQFGNMAWLWQILHVEGKIQPGSSGAYPDLYIVYPLIPWVAVMALGYGIAPWLQRRPKRKSGLLIAGCGLLSGFLTLRYFNTYGDPSPWHEQERGSVFTLLSFFNVSKYPPSLLYLLVTLGLMCVLLAGMENWRNHLQRILALFGRVPLFFYLIHIPFIQGTLLLWKNLTAIPVLGPLLSSHAPDLGGSYLIWSLTLLALYWPCRWFADKKTHAPGKWWISYL